MSIRLVILLVLVVCLAVAFAVRSSAPPPAPTAAELDSGLTPEELNEIRIQQTPIVERELAGSKPEVPPEFFVYVRVDPTGKKNRLYLDVTEAHGYYVEGLTLDVWFSPGGAETGPGRSGVFTHYINKYLKANETLVDCMDLVRPEIERIGGDMGVDADWAADVVRYGRARVANPDPLPIPADDVDRCGAGG